VRLGVSYNLFDGEELLETSISQIRMHVDFICIIYQEISNFGEKREDLRGFLENLVSRGLVDKIFCYSPQKINTTNKLTLSQEYILRGEKNEIIKRNIGKDICLRYGKCSHHISLDCDEMFITEEFERAKEIVKNGNYDTSYVNFVNYYKKPTLQMKEEDFWGYISFITKCDNRVYGKGPSPVIIDPTRKINPNRYHIFNRETIQMHHYSYLRGSEESLRRKLNNTSYKRHTKMIEGIEKVVNSYLNYKDGDKAVIPFVGGSQEKELIKVENKIKSDVGKIIR